MKIYRIKIDNMTYVKGIIIGNASEPLLQVISTCEQDEAAWYEEDKAKKYVEILNKQEGTDLWLLEFVKEVQND